MMSQEETFRVVYLHADGSMPPPHHTEWQITVDSAGEAHLRYWPNYPAPEVPMWESAFPVADLAPLRAALRRAEAAGPPQLPERLPVGGSICRVTCVRGEAAERVLFSGPQSLLTPPLRALRDALRALVPAELWDEMAHRREQYRRAWEAD